MCKIYHTIIIVFFSIFLCGRLAYAQSAKKSHILTIYFEFDSSKINSKYMGNAYALRDLDMSIANNTEVKSIKIYSLTSPEGNAIHNKKLSEFRSSEIISHLRLTYPQLKNVDIISYSRVGDWALVGNAVKEFDNPLYMEEVLSITTSDKSAEAMTRKIMSANNGKLFGYLQGSCFKFLRSSEIVVEFAEPIKVHKSTNIFEAPIKTKRIIDAISPRFAIKNNILYDAILLPNIELEAFFKNRWSLNLEYQVAWWSSKERMTKYQLMLVSPEVRFWFNSDSKFNGHFIGAYLMGGYYDIKFNETGNQGDIKLAGGLTYGYYLPVKSNFGIEFSIGVGVVDTKYTKYLNYDPLDTHAYYAGTYKTLYFGITKAKISVVWRLGNNKNKR